MGKMLTEGTQRRDRHRHGRRRTRTRRSLADRDESFAAFAKRRAASLPLGSSRDSSFPLLAGDAVLGWC
jgi:hypothetical protein